jgi:hypothetical protein
MAVLEITQGSRKKAETQNLIALALALGARDVAGWSPLEDDLTYEYQPQFAPTTDALREAIEGGNDPLGDAFCRIFSAAERRPNGAVYTPSPIVERMLDWVESQAVPERIVDPGVGSGRFLVAAGRRFPDAQLIGVEVDPLPALLARAHLAAAGMAPRARIVVEDYRQVQLDRVRGATVFLGNPPYVRHHHIDDVWKRWLTNSANLFDLEASGLSGLHVYFLLATALHAQPGDVGVFITSAEWLDVNYGKLARELLLDVLGLTSMHIIEPDVEPFPGTQTTAVITGFKVGAKPSSIRVGRISGVDDLTSRRPGRKVRRDRFASDGRWSVIAKKEAGKREGFVELGEICRVHRGQVTGANGVWITSDNTFELPDSVLHPAVTKAKELFAAEGVLADTTILKRVIDLPVELDSFAGDEKARIDAFLEYAISKGADQGYVARNRKAWWSVGLKEPAPILASYMARRAPVFVLNTANARHINIAHGLYPRETLDESQLRSLAMFLSGSVSTDQGRTYAGGLTKFEPREMERLLVPTPELLDGQLEHFRR